LNSKKGQTWSIDLMAATVLVTIIMLFSLLLWNNIAVRWNTANDYRQMQTDAMFAAEALMTTAGEPAGWEKLAQIDDNITAIGLADSRNELSYLKLEKLVSENATAYSVVKRRLGVPQHELGIRVTDVERDNTHYEFGRFAGGMNTSVVFERMGMLNGTPVIVQVEVWR
jgi:hypothetical protein